MEIVTDITQIFNYFSPNKMKNQISIEEPNSSDSESDEASFIFYSILYKVHYFTL